MRRKLKFIILLIMMAVIFLLPNYTKAALQANGGTPAVYNVNDWMTGIRQMQATRRSTWINRYDKCKFDK